MTNKKPVQWRSIDYMRKLYGGSKAYWYGRIYRKTIPYSKPTGGRVLIDEGYYLSECDAHSIPSQTQVQSKLASV